MIVFDAVDANNFGPLISGSLLYCLEEMTGNRAIKNIFKTLHMLEEKVKMQAVLLCYSYIKYRIFTAHLQTLGEEENF